MSTKIYNGYVINSANFKKIYNFAMKARKLLEDKRVVSVNSKSTKTYKKI